MTWLKGLCIFTERKHWVLKDSNLAEEGVIKTNGWKLKPDKFKLEDTYFVTIRTINRWNKTLTEMLYSPSQKLQVSAGFPSRRSALDRYSWCTWILGERAEILWLRAVLLPLKGAHLHLQKRGIRFQWENLKDQRWNGTLAITLVKHALLILWRDDTGCFVKGEGWEKVHSLTRTLETREVCDWCHMLVAEGASLLGKVCVI